MKKMLTTIMLAIILLASPTVSAQGVPTNGTVFFSTEMAAKQHCPFNNVVWANLPSGIYHFKGQRWYGNTKNGAYICEPDALRLGERPSRNGQ
jgi:hypothetical protein